MPAVEVPMELKGLTPELPPGKFMAEICDVVVGMGVQ
jgi:hypothetical protein